LNLLKYTCRK